MIIQLDAHENTLTNITPEKVLRRDALNYYYIKLSTSPDWDGMGKVIALKTPDEEKGSYFKSAHMVLGDTAFIPWDKVKAAASENGEIEVIAYGCDHLGDYTVLEDTEGEKQYSIDIRIVTNSVILPVELPTYDGEWMDKNGDGETVPIDVAVAQLEKYAKMIEEYKAYLDAMQEQLDSFLAEFEEKYKAAEENRDNQYKAAEAKRDDQYIEAEIKRSLWTDYDDGAFYTRGDKIFYNGSSYLCTAPDGTVLTGVRPGDDGYWQMIAAKGEDGHGDLTGPGRGEATAEHIAVFADDGKTIKDGGATVSELRYVHPFDNGFKHIPQDGSEGQILMYGGAAGTAKWADLPTTGGDGGGGGADSEKVTQLTKRVEALELKTANLAATEAQVTQNKNDIAELKKIRNGDDIEY